MIDNKELDKEISHLLHEKLAEHGLRCASGRITIERDPDGSLKGLAIRYEYRKKEPQT